MTRFRPLIAAVLVATAACSVAPPAPTPDPTATSSRTATPAPQSRAPTASPTASPPPAADPLAAPGQALVAFLSGNARGSLDVRIDAIAEDGTATTAAERDDLRPNGWSAAGWLANSAVSMGPEGHLLLVLERNGGAGAEDVRTVILDLRDPGSSPVELPGEVWQPHWGPHGLLAWERDGSVHVLDPATARLTSIRLPPDVVTTTVWLEDGRGWLASRLADNPLGSDFGRLLLNGTFEPGRFPLHRPTGLERILGADGGGLGIAWSDGATESVTVLQERRADLPAPCHCVTWVELVEPGDGPGFAGGLWDADGRGVWVPLHERDGSRAWLGHFPEPLVETRVANLPAAGDWAIVGAHPDDRWIALGSSELATLAFVDSAAGTAILVERDGGSASAGPFLVGWLEP